MEVITFFFVDGLVGVLPPVDGGGSDDRGSDDNHLLRMTTPIHKLHPDLIHPQKQSLLECYPTRRFDTTFELYRNPKIPSELRCRPTHHKNCCPRRNLTLEDKFAIAPAVGESFPKIGTFSRDKELIMDS